MTQAEIRLRDTPNQTMPEADARRGTASLDNSIRAAKQALLSDQEDDGHWCYELEADVTIPAEYILMMHFMDEIDTDLQDRLAVYIRRTQNSEGGWPLFQGGRGDLSATVKAYYALKLAGDDPETPHMRHARTFVLDRGGAAHTNVFTRIALAMFTQIPCRASVHSG